MFIVVPCMLFQSLLYCSKSCTSLHFNTLKSHTKTLKIRPYMFRCPLKPSSGDQWLYFARLLNWNVDLHSFNPLNAELNPICYLLALLVHNFLHVSRIRVKSLTLRLLMSFIYGAPILDVSRSHTTTQHSR